MKRFFAWLIVLTTCSVALPAVVEAQLGLSGLLGFGADFQDDDINRFGFHLGGRFGKTFAKGVYLGSTASFFVGEQQELTDAQGSYVAGFRILQLAGEAGYDVGFGPVILRPYLGVGMALQLAEFREHSTDLDLFGVVGATVIFPLGRFYVGGDARVTPVFADDRYTGLTLSGTVGWSFGDKPHDTGAEIEMQETENGRELDMVTD